MKEYLDILKDVRENGTYKSNRTGVGTFSISGAMFKFDMRNGEFPLLTTKKMPPKCIFAELEGFIKGITDKSWYQERRCRIWDEWCNPMKVPYANDEETKLKMKDEPDLGVIYGYQWNNFNGSGTNQLKNAVNTLMTNPTDRRMLVMAWNPCQLDQMALPPCHFGFHLISDGRYLDLAWYQRSVDTFLGLPFNIASYAMLLRLIAYQTKLTPRFLIGHLDDVHIYENHLKQVDLQLSRTPSDLPALKLSNCDADNWTIWDWNYTDFALLGYNPQDKIEAPVAV